MLDSSTFAYLQPTGKQIEAMNTVRLATLDYARVLETILPDGPDKTYILRELRTVGMWANIAITRNPDGSPRSDPPSEAEAVKMPEAVT